MLLTPFTEVVSCILGFKVILVDQLLIPRAVCLPYNRPQYFEYDLDHNCCPECDWSVSRPIHRQQIDFCNRVGERTAARPRS